MTMWEWAWTMAGYFGPLLIIGVVGTSWWIWDLIKPHQKHILYRVRGFRH